MFMRHLDIHANRESWGRGIAWPKNSAACRSSAARSAALTSATASRHNRHIHPEGG